MITDASKRPFDSAPQRAPVTLDTLSEKLIHLERRRILAERILTQAEKEERRRLGIHKMLASRQSKAKHSNPCFMASKLVRNATPVKEDHSFSLCFIFSIDAALRRKKSRCVRY